MASIEARDVFPWAMHPVLYCHICMAIDIAGNSPAFVVVVDSLSFTTTLDKKHSNN
jgi:hypothetical protein